jgi:DNA-binding MarR family transcriptional regulator
VNPSTFQNLDRVIHETGRMAIMSLLAAHPDVSFTEIRDTLNMTDGNLSVHIKTLQQAGYVAVTKSVENRRSRTTCALTGPGRRAFTGYIESLAKIVDETRRAG